MLVLRASLPRVSVMRHLHHEASKAQETMKYVCFRVSSLCWNGFNVSALTGFSVV